MGSWSEIAPERKRKITVTSGGLVAGETRIVGHSERVTVEITVSHTICENISYGKTATELTCTYSYTNN